MMLLCGCQSWCGRYEAQHKLRSPEVYPFRFHIKELRLEAEHYASQEACVVKSKILKQNLLKNYPQYFSDKSSGTLPLEFTIKRLGNKAIQTEKFETLSVNQLPPECNAKELIGYIPWCFNLAPEGREKAFKELKSAEGFLTKYGFTTAEQRHPRYLYETEQECMFTDSA